MSIKNLKLFFSRKEENKTFFRTENNAEISIDNNLAENFKMEDKILYLNLNTQPIKGDHPQEILNELLNNKDE